jgi:hypothetical protein
MPATIKAHTIIVTKLSAAPNNFQFQIQTPVGGQIFCFALLSADMATAAALGSGASATFTYGQDGSPAGPTHTDLPYGYTEETF